MFPDERLKARLGKFLGDLGPRIGGKVPAACQDWASAKAADRFFDNPRVTEETILTGHFAATAARFTATAGTVLVLYDTTEFRFTRNTPDGVGYLARTHDPPPGNMVVWRGLARLTDIHILVGLGKGVVGT